MNLWYHWTGITESGSSSRNLFRAVAIVQKSYPNKSAPITSARKQIMQLQEWNSNSLQFDSVMVATMKGTITLLNGIWSPFYKRGQPIKHKFDRRSKKTNLQGTSFVTANELFELSNTDSYQK